jgi:hypothetical protein
VSRSEASSSGGFFVVWNSLAHASAFVRKCLLDSWFVPAWETVSESFSGVLESISYDVSSSALRTGEKTAC